MDYRQYLNNQNSQNNDSSNNNNPNNYNNSNDQNNGYDGTYNTEQNSSISSNFNINNPSYNQNTIPVSTLTQSNNGSFQSIQNDLPDLAPPRNTPHKHSSGFSANQNSSFQGNFQNNQFQNNQSQNSQPSNHPQNGFQSTNSEHSSSQNVPKSSLAHNTTKNIPAIENTRKIGIRTKKPNMFNPANPFIAGKMTVPNSGLNANNQPETPFNMNPLNASSNSISNQPESNQPLFNPNIQPNSVSPAPEMPKQPQNFSSMDLQGTIALSPSSVIDDGTSINSSANIPSFAPEGTVLNAAPNTANNPVALPPATAPTQAFTAPPSFTPKSTNQTAGQTTSQPSRDQNNSSDIDVQDNPRSNQKSGSQMSSELPRDVFQNNSEETPFSSYVPQHASNSSVASIILPFVGLLVLAVIIGFIIFLGITRAQGGSNNITRGLVGMFPALESVLGENHDDAASTNSNTSAGSQTQEHGAAQDQTTTDSNQSSTQNSQNDEDVPKQIIKSASITVMNGTGRSGEAQKNALKLTNMQFTAVSSTNLTGQTPTQNTVYFKNKASEYTARNVAEILGISTVMQDASLQTLIAVKLIS